MTVNSTRDFIPPEPFEGQNYKPRYARPSASLREELNERKRLCLCISNRHTWHKKTFMQIKVEVKDLRELPQTPG